MIQLMSLEMLMSRIDLVAVRPVARELLGRAFPTGALVARCRAWADARCLLLGRH